MESMTTAKRRLFLPTFSFLINPVPIILNLILFLIQWLWHSLTWGILSALSYLWTLHLKTYFKKTCIILFPRKTRWVAPLGLHSDVKKSWIKEEDGPLIHCLILIQIIIYWFAYFNHFLFYFNSSLFLLFFYLTYVLGVLYG